MDEDDRDSNAFSENDQDEVMEDVDEPENDPEPDNDAEEDEEEVDDDEDAEAETGGGLATGRELSGGADTASTGPNPVGRASLGSANTSHHSATDGLLAKNNNPVEDGTAVDSAEAVAGSLHLRARPEALAARIYDIVPTMAAPQSTSINALAVTPDLRYWMTGGSDGYIRKYDGPGTINGRQLLTVAQRHPFVDSVVKAGILMSYWENEEPPSAAARGAEEHILSPVYSLAVHSRALWLLAGTEGGGINLQSVRHDEGKRITCLQRHTNAVSVLQLAPDEKSVLSGSWDKNILDWDLNDGQVRRQFEGSSGQISAIELRPASGAPIPAQGSLEEPTRDMDATMATSNSKPLSNGVAIGGSSTVSNAMAAGDMPASGASATINGDEPLPDHESLFGSPGGSLFGGSDAMGANPFGDDDIGIPPGSTAIGEVDGDFPEDVGMVLDTGEPALNSFAPVTSPAGAQTTEFSSDSKFVPATGGNGTDRNGRSSAPPPPTSNSTAPAEKDAATEGGKSDVPGIVADPVAEMDKKDSGLVYNGTEHLSQQQKQQQLDQELQQSAETQLLEADGGQEVMETATATQNDSVKQQTGSPVGQEKQVPSATVYSSQAGPSQYDPSQVSTSTFFSATINGTIRIWDRRQNLPVARIGNRPGIPPWCMGACWSPDGNRIYVGRRNGIVEEFDIHKARAGWQPERALRFPAGSGPVSAVRAMVNGRHLVCASHDILRLYDIQDSSALPHSDVPFLIIPGPPRAGVISHLYIDQTSRFMISTAGTRGWEGTNTEALIGYEINSIVK